MIAVPLTCSNSPQSAFPGVALLAPLTGREEIAAVDGGFAGAVALVRRLWGVGEEMVARLALVDFERLVAAVHRAVWGETAECVADCRYCAEAFGFSVPLDAATPPDVDDDARRAIAETGRVAAPEGYLLAPPRVGHVMAGDAAALLAACCVERRADLSDAALEAALAAAFPTGADDVAAACPHCGEAQTLRFDLCRHVPALLRLERPLLMRETHVLASRYHWPLADILSLERTDRRTLARLALADGGRIAGPQHAEARS